MRKTKDACDTNSPEVNNTGQTCFEDTGPARNMSKQHENNRAERRPLQRNPVVLRGLPAKDCQPDYSQPICSFTQYQPRYIALPLDVWLKIFKLLSVSSLSLFAVEFTCVGIMSLVCVLLLADFNPRGVDSYYLDICRSKMSDGFKVHAKSSIEQC
jgi:hypothetical protein